jgi:hypothetical protein
MFAVHSFPKPGCCWGNTSVVKGFEKECTAREKSVMVSYMHWVVLRSQNIKG